MGNFNQHVSRREPEPVVQIQLFLLLCQNLLPTLPTVQRVSFEDLTHELDTYIYGLLVTGVDDDGHLPQVLRSSAATEQVDLLQKDSGHHVSGEAQVSCADGRERQ